MTRFAIFLLFLSVGGWAEEIYNLTVSTSNLKNNKGVVQFSLYNKDGTKVLVYQIMIKSTF